MADLLNGHSNIVQGSPQLQGSPQQALSAAWMQPDGLGPSKRHIGRTLELWLHPRHPQARYRARCGRTKRTQYTTIL